MFVEDKSLCFWKWFHLLKWQKLRIVEQFMKHQLNHWERKIKVHDNSRQNHFKIILCTTINVYSVPSKSD